ncbi:MAG TPA: CBS domain-containing protein [Thermoanaerobaculia bacterium]
MSKKDDREISVSSNRETNRGSVDLSSVMTRNPQCVTESDSLQDVARLMLDCDCGALPVVGENEQLIGMITDRDIVVRVIAEGRDCSQATVRDAMTSQAHSVRESDSLESVFRIMRDNKVRRVPVVDENQRVIGIVAQADLALDTSRDREVGKTVEKISEPERPRERA